MAPLLRQGFAPEPPACNGWRCATGGRWGGWRQARRRRGRRRRGTALRPRTPVHAWLVLPPLFCRRNAGPARAHAASTRHGWKGRKCLGLHETSGEILMAGGLSHSDTCKIPLQSLPARRAGSAVRRLLPTARLSKAVACGASGQAWTAVSFSSLFQRIEERESAASTASATAPAVPPGVRERFAGRRLVLAWQRVSIASLLIWCVPRLAYKGILIAASCIIRRCPVNTGHQPPPAALGRRGAGAPRPGRSTVLLVGCVAGRSFGRLHGIIRRGPINVADCAAHWGRR